MTLGGVLQLRHHHVRRDQFKNWVHCNAFTLVWILLVGLIGWTTTIMVCR